ncbi:MAG: hypothetical protein J5I90_18675 [Caldilineales bacterium]|nr:hypothetical protein [Caldilineales bacterium]
MTYVFVFLGEFGYELFNWQGVIRRFKTMVEPDARIIIGGRAHLQAFYEFADAYIEISSVDIYQQSRAMAYFALPTVASSWDSFTARRFDKTLKAEIKSYLGARLLEIGIDPPACKFVFSSDYTEIGGLKFGRPRRRLPGVLISTLAESIRSLSPGLDGWLEQTKNSVYQNHNELNHNRKSSIYEWLDPDNNLYRQITPDLSVCETVAEKLGWPLSEPFILCQTRHRDESPRSTDLIPTAGLNALLGQISQHFRIVLLSFNTGRAMDSYSMFDHNPNFYTYHCSGFPEQSCLIHHAARCLFFTEGDFGSHIYLPPFMGKEVFAVAPHSVYQLGTTPIDFWNENVFRFGGQIIPLTAEASFSSADAISALAQVVMRKDSRPTIEVS